MKGAVAGITLGIALLATPAFADRSSTSVEQGYDLGETPHPRSLGLAGQQQVFGGSTSALFLNPANLPLYKVYHLEGIAAFGPEARRQTYGGAIVDSTRSITGGFSGTYNTMDPDGIHRTWTDLRLSLAYAFGERVSIGVAGRYLRLIQHVGIGPLGPSLASDGTPDDPAFSGFTFDAGGAVNITEHLRLSVSGRNLTATNTGFAPLVVAGGLGWSNGTYTFEGDALVDTTTYDVARGRYGLSGEAFISDRFPVRLGYRYDDGMKTHTIGVGAGYVDKRFSVELGVKRDVGGEHQATMLGVGLRIFIEQVTGNAADQPDF